MTHHHACLPGTANSSLYNPFLHDMQSGAGCNAWTTGQVHLNGNPFAEVASWQPESDLEKCKIAVVDGHKVRHYHATGGCFQPQQNGTVLAIQLPDGMIVRNPASSSFNQLTKCQLLFSSSTPCRNTRQQLLFSSPERSFVYMLSRNSCYNWGTCSPPLQCIASRCVRINANVRCYARCRRT